jgi:hypothetical protein
MAPGSLVPLALGGLFSRHLTIVSRPIDTQLRRQQSLDLLGEHMLLVVRGARIIARLAVVTGLALGFVHLVELVDSLDNNVSAAEMRRGKAAASASRTAASSDPFPAAKRNESLFGKGNRQMSVSKR